MELGFSEEASREALIACEGDERVAVNKLLGM
jgi:hypothetical protein